MAFEEDIRKSKFNAGVAHIERIDSLQRAINAAKFNPFMKNFETGTYNYEILITAIDSLIAEGWEKFSDEERDLVSRMNNVLVKLNKHFPPISVMKSGEVKVNRKNYEDFMKFFQITERKIKDLYGLHHLNSPSRGEEDEDEL